MAMISPAALKWLDLTADIVGYEVAHAADDQMLSEFCDRLILRNPIAGRVLIISAGLLLTAHLSNLINPAHDPMSQTFWRGRFKRS